jgi:adenosylhomocysteine nucleosidase
MSRIAIIAALPGELKPLVRGWQHESIHDVDLWRWRHDGGEWIAACAGAGVDAATRAFVEVESKGAVDRAISVGWAGGLREDLTSGQAYNVSGVIDVRTGERFEAACLTEANSQELLLVTSPKAADFKEKRRLAATYQAALVDMEAAGVARLAKARGIPFCCIKGISDGYSDQLPDFNCFISPSGRLQMGRIVVFSLLSPWHWRALMRMGENSNMAADAIAKLLLDLLDQQGQIRKRNDYPNHQSY